MAIDWSLLGQQHPLDVFGPFKSGYALGKGLKDQREEDSALSSLATDPSDNNALAKLMRVNPALEARMEDRNIRREDRSREDSARSALSGFIEHSLPMPEGVTGTAPTAAAQPSADAPAGSMGPHSSLPMSDAWHSYVKSDPEGAMKFLLTRAKLGKDQAAALGGQFDVMARLAQSAKDEPSYQAALAQAREQGFDTSHLPPHYDPAVVDTIMRQALSAKEHLTLEHNIADDNVDNAETERHHKADESNAQRGQDLSSIDRERGQDLSGVDRRRGQDLSHVDRVRGQDKRGKKGGGGGGGGRPTIIVNPKTGAKMKLVNGAWVPA